MTNKEPVSLDGWLGNIYQDDNKGRSVAAIAAFKVALGLDANLMATARARLIALNEMISVRGERACAYSTKYRNYLQEALA